MKKAEAAAITKGQPPVAKPPVTQIISLFRKNFPLWATKPSGDRNMKLAKSTSPIRIHPKSEIRPGSPNYCPEALLHNIG